MAESEKWHGILSRSPVSESPVILSTKVIAENGKGNAPGSPTSLTYVTAGGIPSSLSRFAVLRKPYLLVNR